MIRQRIGLRDAGVGELVLRLLVSLLAAALIFYGVMVVLAAFKLDPETINRVSAYRTVQHDLTSITAGDISGRDRIIVAIAGLICAAVFGPLAYRALPRPYLSRTSVDAVPDTGAGHTRVAARAIERVAEQAAVTGPRVRRAHARCGEGTVAVGVTLSDAGDLLETLTEIQGRVRDGLADHGLHQDTTIDVTFDAEDPTTSAKDPS